MSMSRGRGRGRSVSRSRSSWSSLGRRSWRSICRRSRIRYRLALRFGQVFATLYNGDRASLTRRSILAVVYLIRGQHKLQMIRT